MSESYQDKNKRIVKNSLYLYARMFIMLAISLFTARVVYNTLGVDNYGIYGLVGGIIVFFTFLNNGLSSATRRFITADIADNNIEKGHKTFNVCIQAHVIISIIIFVLAETIGLWIVNHVLNIPPDRMNAANWVYQLSIFSAILGIMQSPFGTVITAYEKMNIYAYFTIFDVIFKLLVIYAVQAINGDKLIVYALLIFGVGIVNMAIYRIYTFRAFKICHLKKVKDLPLLKEIFKFMSWSVLGQAAVVGTNQGVNVLVNVFHSVAVNAAMSVSSRITGLVNQFVSNFQVAFNPQIIKSYNTKDYTYVNSLVIRSSKISSFLLIIFFVPLVFETSNVLTLWLGSYPKYAVEFCILTLCCSYIETICNPLWTVVYAQTNIRNYQIYISSVYSLNFLIGWLILYLGAEPYYVLLVRFIVFLLLMVIRLIFVIRFLPGFNMKEWIKEVFAKDMTIVFLSVGILFLFNKINNLPLFSHILATTAVSLCCTLPMIYFGGMSNSEKQFVKNNILNKIKK